jgi:hypothetical protein
MSHQKILASLRRLPTGASYRDMDDNARSEESLRSSFKLLVLAVLRVFGKPYNNREPKYDKLKNMSRYVGRCGANNDITVLVNSPFLIDILTEKRKMNVLGRYIISNTAREWPVYKLCDGIYPKWAILDGPNHSPMSGKEKFFAKRQEATRKKH